MFNLLRNVKRFRKYLSAVHLVYLRPCPAAGHLVSAFWNGLTLLFLLWLKLHVSSKYTGELSSSTQRLHEVI